ncbi:MAG: SET domain-containing protein-lysine N-methyltransferase [Candidatus Micrarchaeota archaeon]
MTKDLHDIWPHRWMTNKAKAINSKIHGLGTMAAEDIKKGETVAVLGGIVINKAQIRDYWKMMGEVGIQIDDDFFICPSSREELEKTGVFNHSCEPNCGFGGTLRVVAIRDIKKGEELLSDYAFYASLADGFECRCGSPDCRKVIKPDDWKNPALQNRYAGYFSPYLKQKVLMKER